MTERKKEYIMDALSEIKDAYIAEVAEYEKPVRRWKYWRECSAVAACVGAVVITVAAWQYLPIGSSESAQNTTAKKEMWTGDGAPESSLEQGSSGATAESTTAVKVTKGETEYKSEDAEEEVVHAVEGVEEELTDVYKSQNISWEIVYDSREAGGNIAEIGSSVNQTVGKESVKEESQEQQKGNTQTSLKSESISEYRSAEEMLAEGRDIFRGIVTEKQILHMTEGFYHYFTILTVEVEHGIRGELKAGDEYKIYLPVAATDRLIQDNSLSGDLTKLAVGSRAIFMPERAKDGVIVGTDASLFYEDFADYYFTEGLRYLFLEQKDEVSYAEEVYKVPAGAAGSVTLEDVTAYLQEMIAVNN